MDQWTDESNNRPTLIQSCDDASENQHNVHNYQWLLTKENISRLQRRDAACSEHILFLFLKFKL